MQMTHEIQMRVMGTVFIRDLKFSDIVPDTVTIFNHKKDKNQMTSNMALLRGL